MLTRWDPFREMMSFRRAMDRIFENTLTGRMGDWEPSGWGLALDVVEDEDEYVVKASIPGVKPDDLDITYSGNTLTIKGETKSETVEETRYYLRERRYGRFARSITLPTDIDEDKIEANYEGGVLTLHLPKVEKAKAKKIAIRSRPSTKVIEG